MLQYHCQLASDSVQIKVAFPSRYCVNKLKTKQNQNEDHLCRCCSGHHCGNGQLCSLSKWVSNMKKDWFKWPVLPKRWKMGVSCDYKQMLSISWIAVAYLVPVEVPLTRVARAAQFGLSGSAANAGAQSFNSGFGGFGASGSSANAASQSFTQGGGFGFPGNIFGGRKSWMFGR